MLKSVQHVDDRCISFLLVTWRSDGVRGCASSWTW